MTALTTLEEISIVLDPGQVEHVRTRELHYGIEHTYFARLRDRRRSR
ncbi:hypothetical protein [Nocardia amamiensis]|nr:hypothetical protein [Nocardia amamiensis]